MLPKAFVVLTGLLLLGAPAARATIHQVDISGFDFVPPGRTINQGDSIRWTNLDGVTHSSVSDDGLWDSGPLANDDSFVLPFDTPGVFAYHCVPHTSMLDTITVIAPADIEIGIGDNFFDPPVVRVNAGETVRWTNNGSMTHTATALSGAFDSGDLEPEMSFTFTFTQEGFHDYECIFHPGMAGTIVVATPDSVALDIDIANMAFSPSLDSVIIGQYVRWVNLDPMAHTTTENTGLWDSGTLVPGDFFIYRADSAGSFGYFCSFHPEMTGMLLVKDTTTSRGDCAYVPGDINGNGQTNGVDVTYGVAFFKGGNVPPVDCASPAGPCEQGSPYYAAGDVNGNCQFNGVDVTYYVAYLKGLQPALQHCPTCPPAARN